MESRPRISLTLSAVDRILEFISLLLLLLTIAFAVYAYCNLPSTIPVHFNLSGEPNGYGSRSTVFVLAGIAAILYGLLSWLNKFPHIFNYPVAITKENAERQYRNATQMMRVLKLSISIVFLIAQATIYLAAKGKAAMLQPYVLPVILAVVFAPIVYYVLKSFKK